MKAVECKNRELWDSMVRSSKYTLPTHLWFSSDNHLVISENGRMVLLPFARLGGLAKTIRGMPKMSGGPAPLRDPRDFELLAGLLEYLRDTNYDLFVFTFKVHWKPELALNVIKAVRDSSFRFTALPTYARILDLPRDQGNVWNLMNKKARNLVRKFRRSGGYVEVIKKPLDVLNGIMSVNLSGVFRQGRPLPRGYTDVHAVASRLNELSRYTEFEFYGAFLNGDLVGYAYVLSLNGYAYISRFLTHRGYFKIGVSEGLLTGVLESLSARGVKRVQYAYWSPLSHPGVDHFLRQFGFRRGLEFRVYVPLTAKGALVIKTETLKGRVRHVSRGSFLMSPMHRLSELYSYVISSLA